MCDPCQLERFPVRERFVSAMADLHAVFHLGSKDGSVKNLTCSNHSSNHTGNVTYDSFNMSCGAPRCRLPIVDKMIGDSHDNHFCNF